MGEEINLTLTREEAKFVYFELDRTYTEFHDLGEYEDDNAWKAERDMMDNICQRLWTAAGGNL